MWFRRTAHREQRKQQDRVLELEQVQRLDRQHMYTSHFIDNWGRFERAYTIAAVLNGDEITPLRNARIERDSLKVALAITVPPDDDIGHIYITAYNEARAEMDDHLVCWEKRIVDLENEMRKPQEEKTNA